MTLLRELLSQQSKEIDTIMSNNINKASNQEKNEQLSQKQDKMYKKFKQITAIIALSGILILIIAFVISAFSTGEASGEKFMALFFGIITVPILAWLFIFCYGRFTGKHTMAEFFPEDNQNDKKEN